MPRKHRSKHVNHERWLVSYADFITLLFAFFVVMFATSQSDMAKAQAVSDSVKRALEGQTLKSMIAEVLRTKESQPRSAPSPPPVKIDDKPKGKMAELLPSLEVLRMELQEEIKSGALQINMGSRGLTISFTQAALFPSGEELIAQNTYHSIQKIASAINRIPNPIRLEGHTDDVPIHNSRFRSNWELSAARSIALLELLNSFGVSRERMSIAGYADTAPLIGNDTPEGRQKNRRVDLIILNETGAMGEPDRFIVEK